MLMHFVVKKFTDLSLQELYDVLQLRAEVFVVEQDCVYQDIDGKDQKALHILGFINNKVVGYTRIFKAGDYFDTPSMGRVVVAKNQRKYSYGHQLITASITAIKKHYAATKITISAQTYLKNFYESHGFNQVGEEYLEDGILHIRMLRI